MSEFLNTYLTVSNWLYASFLFVIVGLGQIWLYLKDRKRKYPEVWPTVSVLISAKNEEEAISECIESLLKLEYPQEKLDIWIVDDQSTDKTAQIIKSYQVGNPHIKMLSTETYDTHLKAKARGISLAAKHAKGEWFFITDADSVVQPLWIKEMLRGIDHTTGTIAGMMTVEEHNLVSILEKSIWNYTLPFAAGAAGYGAEFISVGPNTAMRSKIYHEAGGLEKADFKVAEDLALFNMVLKSEFKPIAHSNHETMVTMKPVSDFRQLLSQQRRWIKGPFEREWYYPAGILIVFGFSFLYHIAITVALFFAPIAALIALLSRFVAELCIIFIEKLILKQKRVLRYYPMLFIYLYFVFIFLPLSFMVTRRISWQGDGYKIEYN